MAIIYHPSPINYFFLLVWLGLGSFTLGAQQTRAEDQVDYDTSIRPLISRYCLKCHSGEKAKGEVDLERFTSVAEIHRHPALWKTVAEQLASQEMPPEDKPQPSTGERDRVIHWIRSQLKTLALARAGDPGPVVVRRLSNAEYTYTVRDLTGLPTLDPAREFPVDGAAGEGFMNTGNGLVMSPALLPKYLDAAKEIASHAVLLPDGLRFSPGLTRRDWTDELLGRIREYYGRYSVGEGKIPLEKYLHATLAERETLRNGTTSLAQVARDRGLNELYLARLWQTLEGAEQSSSPLLKIIGSRWRAGQPGDAKSITAEIEEWQQALWKFGNVGHMKPWMTPVDRLLTRQELRLKIPRPEPGKSNVILYLASFSPAAPDPARPGDEVVWHQPRLVAAGQPDLLLRDVRDYNRDLSRVRERLFPRTTQYLAAVSVAGAVTNVTELAERFSLEQEALRSWLHYLGMGPGNAVKIDSHFTSRMTNVSGHSFISGWGSGETPLVVANSSDQHVRIPGNMKPHSVAVHPSPKLRAAVGWSSPVAATVQIEALVERAHPECGPGVTWTVELRRGATRQRLASGQATGADPVKIVLKEKLAVLPGDLVSVVIGPRNGDHACGLTAVNLVLAATGIDAYEWNLWRDVSGDLSAANPHRDALGRGNVWHFYTEPDQGGGGSFIPAGSLLARWQLTESAAEKAVLAEELQRHLTGTKTASQDSPDATLYRQLTSMRGPLLGKLLLKSKTGLASPASGSGEAQTAWGPDPALFGRRPGSGSLDSASLGVPASSLLELELPADLVEGCELVTSGYRLAEQGGGDWAQLQILTAKPAPRHRPVPQLPLLIPEGAATRSRLESALNEFRSLFPAAVCYSRIVPVDEVITLTQFHREDEAFCRLFLEEAQKAQLDRMWNELRYISRDALTLVDAFAQLLEYASQDGDPRLFEPLRVPIQERAAALRQQLLETEPRHLQAVLDLAARALRHPLSETEAGELRGLYRQLRDQDLPHEEAIRLTLARILVSPAFLYRLEKPGPGTQPGPVSDWELATRLSYFLFSSTPDDALRAAAAAGQLRSPDGLAGQARRLLQDARARRLATEFACQWLHVHSFDQHDEKSERHFPGFPNLRGAMYEESILFFTDLFQRNGSVLEILDADHTFLNETLARHYGIPGVAGAGFRRVNGVKAFGRGGILGLASTLARQSGASRTSPILRGNWVCETLLGEKLPRPPKDVPTLPEEETATEGLTMRQITEKHTRNPSCARCHQRIDPYGYALEAFDPIGRRRTRDLGDRLIETRVKAMDGAIFEGLEGLRHYLLDTRQEAFLRQFNRKLLGYSLGRATLLSDEPLLDEMLRQLKADQYRFGSLVETIVRSRQFREIRGVAAVDPD